MNYLKKIQEIKKMKDDGILTEEEFNKEKEKLLNQKTKRFPFVIVGIILLVAFIVIALVLLFNSNKTKDENGGFNSISSNIQKANAEKVSFKNMSADDKNLDKVQQEIIKYFDNDYLYLDVEDSQRFPQVYKNAKVTDWGKIVKVLKSENDEFEVLVYSMNTGIAGLSGLYEDLYDGVDYSNIPEKDLIVIKGEQLEERLLENDIIRFYGRYTDISS